jgi:hypothetical protein
MWKQHRIFIQSMVHGEFMGVWVTPNVYPTLDELNKFCEVAERGKALLRFGVRP